MVSSHTSATLFLQTAGNICRIFSRAHTPCLLSMLVVDYNILVRRNPCFCGKIPCNSQNMAECAIKIYWRALIWTFRTALALLCWATSSVKAVTTDRSFSTRFSHLPSKPHHFYFNTDSLLVKISKFNSLQGLLLF